MIEINNIQNYKEFLPLKTLYKEFKSLIGQDSISIIGQSKSGQDILSGKIGTGKKSVLLIGYPHPNEPIGSLTCLSWIKILKKNQQLLDEYSWQIIPCVDPDGARLNQGWYKGKFSIKKYVYNFYRQINDQTEWSFPIKYKKFSFNKPTKQTRALIKLIDKVKPSIVYSLHNSSFSGAYFLQTRKLNDKHFASIEQACKRLHVPLHKGKIDVPFATEFRQSFYKLFAIKEEYDFLEKLKQDPTKIVGGTSSADYAKTQNKQAFSMVCEIPYIYDPALSDSRASKISKSDAVQMQINDNQGVYNFISIQMKKPGLNKQSVFYQVNKENVSVLNEILKSQKAFIDSLPEVKATVAELFTSQVSNVFYRTLFLGEYRRLLLDSKQTKKTITLIKETEKMIDKRIQYINKNSNYRIIPISSLVKLQIIYLAETLKHIK